MKTTVEFENNGFDIIRYLAALLVMMLHYASFMLILTDKITIVMNGARQLALLFPGVVILFTLSGFLISASFENAKTRKAFLKKRAKRIYPELWICTIVNLVVVSIVVPQLLDKSIFLWLAAQTVGIAYTPSGLKAFATGSINGTLWTVFTEVQLYIVLAIVYPFLKRMKNGLWAVLLVLLAAANLVCETVAGSSGGIAYKLIERSFVPYALWFFIGVFCYLKRQKVLPCLKKLFFPLLILYVILNLLPVKLPGYYTNIGISILLPLLIIGGGYCLPKIRFRCDLSYGLFLYHWIVLNVIVHFDFMNKLPWSACLLLFIALSFCLSWFSWRIGKTIGNRIT